jgi:hypothetical protein
MRFRDSAFVIAAAGLVVLACGEAPRTAPTEPLRPDLINPASTCDAAVSNQVQADIDLLFRSSDRSQVKGEWSKVAKLCPNNLAAAAAEQKIYIQLTINKYKAGVALDPNGTAPPTTQELLVLDWDRTATFVGEPVYGLTPSVLDANGAVGVIGAAGGNLLNAVQTAGIRVNPNAISNSRLFSIAPLADCSTLSSQTNLDLTPLCFDLHVNPVTAFVSPFVDVEVCPVEGTPAAIMGRGHLAHPKIAELALLPSAGNNIFGWSCSNALADANTPEPGGVVGALRQFAQHTLQWLRPTAAYAGHGGLTAKTDGFSSFGTADPDIFLATMTADAVNLPPGPPEKGTWTIQTANPGSVLVKSSLGDINSNLLVINQQGGNCTNCGGLNVIGTVKGSNAIATPENGTYLVSWRSVVSTPNVNYVPFVLRDADGDELARLEYRSGGAAQTGPLTFNGASLVVGSWARNISQLFEITVDLVNNTASLSISINGVVVGGAPAQPFVSSSATNIKTISIEIVGNDVQTIGWDSIEIRRQVDPLPGT